MAKEPVPLSQADVDRLYSSHIKPDLLDDIGRSPTPTAVLVAGQPGSATSYVAAQVRAHLTASIGPIAVVSGDDLRHYHPQWQAAVPTIAQVPAHIQSNVGEWYARLTTDAMAAGANLILITSMRQPQVAHSLMKRFKEGGYRVAAVVLASDRDQSHQAALAFYDVARAAGARPRFIPTAQHEEAYERLRAWLQRVELDRAADRIQVVARDGRQLYANETIGDRWAREPRAVHTLDDFRDRRLTARELADGALRWQTLVQRLTTDATVPREIASQALAWRNEATARAETDPDARRLMAWGREAEAFRTMGRHLFVREFPQHAKAVERLEQAIVYAEKEFPTASEREQFILQTRERLAERIAEGRYATPKAQGKERGS